MSASAGASEVENIEPLPMTFGKIVNNGAHVRREEKEREH
jgi:hypothetical protein